MNLEVHNISGKNNAMVDMLSREKYEDESDTVLEYEDVKFKFFKMAQASVEEWGVQVLNTFYEREYEGEWLHIGTFFKFDDCGEFIDEGGSTID